VVELKKQILGVFMRKSVIVLMALALAAHAGAQVGTETLTAEVDQQIDQMSGVSTAPSSRAVVTQTVVVPQQQNAVQKQPLTYVEASPLGDSRAESIRKNRQEEEMRTESRIVEKLEQSRMEDEKRRASVLFGDKFDNLQNGGQTAPAPVVVAPQPQMAPPSQVQPQTIIVEKEKEEGISRDEIREEIRAALSENEEQTPAPELAMRYFAGVAGISSYTNDTKAKGQYSLGAAFGNRYDLLLVEGSFIYSNYTVGVVDRYRYCYYPAYGVAQQCSYLGDDFASMNQYQGAVAAKYQFLGGFVRPYEFNNPYYSGDGRSFAKGDSLATSHALDLGTDVGVDLEFNERLSVGASFKYFFNLAASVDGDTGGLEKNQYFMSTISARVNF
jgi:hypothetical protein